MADGAIKKVQEFQEQHEWVAFTVNTQGATGSGTLVKYGRMVQLAAIIRPNQTGSNLSLGWIPDRNGSRSHWAPTMNSWISCDYYGSQTQHAEASMEADGVLKVNTPIKDVDLKVSGCWISKG